MRIKPHKKTRKGCYCCKRRRVKCDEAKPSCSNCQDREEACHYPYQKSEPVSLNEKRQLELRLSHQWCTETCRSFTSQQTVLLRDHAIEQAQSHVFLMDAIFALSAAHLASKTTAAPKALLQASLRYHTDAVSALQAAVESSNLEAVFLASILTMATSVVLPLLHGESAAQCLLHIQGFLKGVWTIIDLNPDAFLNGPCASMFGQTSAQECVASVEDLEAMRRLRELRELQAGDQTYDRTIDELELCFTRNRKRAISWVKKTWPGFIDAVCNHEPFALLVLLHWAVALCGLEEMWWAKYAGQALVEELANVGLESQGEEWAAAVSWAKDQAAQTA
ncbi:uncharacterized protein LTR77_008264 [Saxophila tyrrhenica]|uniref:Zn(2)-C6 fungal-type domain-containing protein n=1 Tax=Saxophila tyrrhenica TaxID=1690608 RepID=A0AAV9P4B2_9PEZI|nr:hypothetical protein LTR77_008264 [Saxophila tyrrhenica]